MTSTWTGLVCGFLSLMLLLQRSNGQTTRVTTTRSNGNTIPNVFFISGFTGWLGISWDGGAMQSGITNVMDCATRCIVTAACESFDFNFRYNHCWIHTFSTCSQPNLQLTCADCHHYKKWSVTPCGSEDGGGSGNPTVFQNFLPVESGMGIRSGTETFPSQNTVEACLEYCNQQTNCIVVEYNSQDLSCWWHSSTTGCNTPYSCPTCQQYRHNRSPCGVTPSVSSTPDPTAGDKYDLPGSTSTSLLGGTRFPGTFAMYYSCLTKCSQEPTCQGVDFDTVKLECWWHSSSSVCGTPRTVCTSCVHYKNKRAACYVEMVVTPTITPPTQTAAPTVGSKYPLVYTNMRISTGGTFVQVVNSLEGCFQLCDSRADCQAVVYISNPPTCLLHQSNTACATRVSETGYTVYQHQRITCGDGVFSDFNAAISTRRIATANLISTVTNLLDCLNGCQASTNCQGINFQATGNRCEHIIDGNQCNTVDVASGYVHYLKNTVTCAGDPVFQRFVAAQTNRRHQTRLNIGVMSLVNCLKNCQSLPSCGGVNYRSSTSVCERVQNVDPCSNILFNSGYSYYRKVAYACTGSTVTTTVDPTTLVQAQACWTKMTATTSCRQNRPATSLFSANFGKMEDYCWKYNTYFGCLLTQRRAIDCPSVPWQSLAAYVSQTQAMIHDNVQFCSIFSNGLYECTLTANTINDRGRCITQLPIQPITSITPQNEKIDRCPQLRWYTECVSSVMDFRCKDYANEFREKAINNLLAAATNCLIYSSPLISGQNAYVGPINGSPKLIITGEKLLDINSQPRIVFGTNTDPCLANTLSLSQAQVSCDLKKQSGFTQQQLNQGIGLNKLTDVRLWYPQKASIYFTTGNFTYKPDPVVTGLMPTETVVGGGTSVTVKGNNLGYVVTPELTVTRIYGGAREITSSICKNDPDVHEMLICKVPPISLPPGVTYRNNELVNSPTQLYYFMGLKLDNILNYGNLTLAGVTGDRLKVYGPPEIDPTPKRVFDFKLFWPVQQSVLDIEGNYKSEGASQTDYKVLIGDKQCDNVKVDQNRMQCEPPKKNPFTNGSNPIIMLISPGPLEYRQGLEVGELHYQNSIWENDAGKYGLIGGAIGVVLLFIILIVVCCCCCSCCPGAGNRDKYQDSNYSTSDGE